MKVIRIVCTVLETNINCGCLVACGATPKLYDSWKNFLQVFDVFLALGYINCLPELRNPINQLLLSSWFDFSAHELFQFVPQVLYGIAVGRFWWRFPPIYPFGLQEVCHTIRSMLWVIILHYPMTSRVDVVKKRKQPFSENILMSFCSHYPFKYHYWSSSPPTDASPDVYFH